MFVIWDTQAGHAAVTMAAKMIVNMDKRVAHDFLLPVAWQFV
jgi:hypothetical protein